MIFLLLIGILLIVGIAILVRAVLTNKKVDEYAKDYFDFTPKCESKPCESKPCKCEFQDVPDIEGPGNGKVKDPFKGEGI